ncbi:MAG: DUF2490 domain-containing protein [Lutibacter sp.]|nr:DUF2490 domain-containing protein [Lutibacter sp.]
MIDTKNYQKRPYKYLVLAILLMGLSNVSLAQKSETGNWFIYIGNQKINDKWNWHNEIQYRNFNFMGDLEQLVLRTGIGYNLTENNNNVLLGYGFIHSEPYIVDTNEKKSINEHRIYQQFLTRQSFHRVNIAHRYRIEERFMEDDFKLRFRYFLSFNIPINKKEMTKNAVYISAYNELFLNAEKPVFDRNRVYGGLGIVLNKNFRVETAIMTQVFENNDKPQFQIVLFNNLPF